MGKNGVVKEVAIVVEFVYGGGAQAMAVLKFEEGMLCYPEF